MTSGEDFLRRCAKAQKKDRTGYEEQVRKAFFSSLSFCPEDMLWDLYSDLTERNREKPDGLEEILASVIDLFSGDYDSQTDFLDNEDVSTVCGSVNEYALDLPDDTVFQIMKIAVERGILG